MPPGFFRDAIAIEFRECGRSTPGTSLRERSVAGFGQRWPRSEDVRSLGCLDHAPGRRITSVPSTSSLRRAPRRESARRRRARSRSRRRCAPDQDPGPGASAATSVKAAIGSKGGGTQRRGGLREDVPQRLVGPMVAAPRRSRPMWHGRRRGSPRSADAPHRPRGPASPRQCMPGSRGTSAAAAPARREQRRGAGWTRWRRPHAPAGAAAARRARRAPSASAPCSGRSPSRPWSLRRGVTGRAPSVRMIPVIVADARLRHAPIRPERMIRPNRRQPRSQRRQASDRSHRHRRA